MDKAIYNKLREHENSTFNNYVSTLQRNEGIQEASYIYSVVIPYLAYITKISDNPISEESLREKFESETVSSFLYKSNKKYESLINSIADRFDEESLLASILFTDNRTQNSYGDNSTPESISELSFNLLELKEDDILLDFGSGSGDFLINASLKNINSRFYGIDINTDNIIVSTIRSKIINNNISLIQGNILSQDFGQISANKVFSNFPIGIRFQNIEKQIQNNSNLKAIFKDSKRTITSDWAFVLAAYYAMSRNGKVVCIMANSGTWNQADQSIRKLMVEKGIIEGIISLPSNLLSYTSIPLTLVVLSNNNHSIKMVDASEIFTEGRRQNYLTTENIDEILGLYNQKTEFSTVIDIEDLKKNEYVLNPRRYIDYDDIEDGISLGEIALSINRGAMIRSSELDELITTENTEYSYLMLQNISDGIIDKSLPKLKSIEKKMYKYCIENNSLIISKNSPFKIALAKFNNEEKILANGNLYFITLDENKVNPVFVEAYLQSEAGIAQLSRLAKGTVMSSISIQDLKRLKVPRLDLEVQNKIALEYEDLKEQLIVLERQIETVRNNRSKLLEGVI